jgi:hypothetical protein
MSTTLLGDFSHTNFTPQITWKEDSQDMVQQYTRMEIFEAGVMRAYETEEKEQQNPGK